MVKNPPANAGDLRDMSVGNTRVRSLGQDDPLKEGMATHSSILARRIPWTEEPGGLQSIGSHSWTQLKWLSMHVPHPPKASRGLWPLLKPPHSQGSALLTAKWLSINRLWNQLSRSCLGWHGWDVKHPNELLSPNNVLNDCHSHLPIYRNVLQELLRQNIHD